MTLGCFLALSNVVKIEVSTVGFESLGPRSESTQNPGTGYNWKLIIQEIQNLVNSKSVNLKIRETQNLGTQNLGTQNLGKSKSGKVKIRESQNPAVTQNLGKSKYGKPKIRETHNP